MYAVIRTPRLIRVDWNRFRRKIHKKTLSQIVFLMNLFYSKHSIVRILFVSLSCDMNMVEVRWHFRWIKLDSRDVGNKNYDTTDQTSSVAPTS